ncbi:peptidyl-prolyl cis-trans isomerase fkbp6-like [Stylonychia lemnae]|uniref:peptidylprolyl isomerase n=1 Tax=Stylonychia lemnae TaxID=5949 RepID=A0A078AZV2_STYLE|nr:peptidyl-prolyl cis-trans isomerase fkbp6-like [Stylonychia lemnae]|eukprot:CDW86323.1 peptidyl-prolyl cis-trans isomerase fkbp6-like [Stylonychia lemnae]
MQEEQQIISENQNSDSIVQQTQSQDYESQQQTEVLITDNKNTGANTSTQEVAMNDQTQHNEDSVLSQEEQLSEEAKEKIREENKWKNFVPTEQKRPIDEFFDLKSISPIREERIPENNEIVKYVIEDGKGSFIGLQDEVFYKHETRFDNGQLVDFSEKRNAIDKFVMSDSRFHDFYKLIFKTMRKGEIAWGKFPKSSHNGIYHSSTHFQNKPEEIKAQIGDDVYIKFSINNIKRNNQCPNSNSFECLEEYLGQIRSICKELMDDGEYPNAQNLYSRVYASYKNMSKVLKDSLTEEQKQKRDEALHLLSLNLSITHFKRNNFKDSIKHAKEALEYNKENPKAYFRLAMSFKGNGQLEEAKEQLVTAIKLAPSDKSLRDEYKQITDQMMTKEKEWYSKMNGFYSSKKMSDIEQKDYEEQILKQKLTKKHFQDQ